MDKKGVSQVIGYVLLIAFVVAGGTAMFFAVRDTAEEQTARTVEHLEGTFQCEGIRLRALNCFTLPTGPKLNLTNTGTRGVDRFLIRGPGFSEFKDRDLSPNEFNHVGIEAEGFDKEVVPIVIVDDVEYVCTNNRLIHPGC